MARANDLKRLYTMKFNLARKQFSNKILGLVHKITYVQLLNELLFYAQNLKLNLYIFISIELFIMHTYIKLLLIINCIENDLIIFCRQNVFKKKEKNTKTSLYLYYWHNSCLKFL